MTIAQAGFMLPNLIVKRKGINYNTVSIETLATCARKGMMLRITFEKDLPHTISFIVGSGVEVVTENGTKVFTNEQLQSSNYTLEVD